MILVLLISSLTAATMTSNNPDAVYEEFVAILETKTSCYYQYLEKDLELSVHVAPYVEAKINLRVKSPSGMLIEEVKGVGTFVKMVHNTTEAGDYEMCIIAPHAMNAYFHMAAFNRSVFVDPENATKWMLESLRADTTPKVLLNMYKNLEISLLDVRTRNTVYKRDIRMQRTSSGFITWYVVVFCISAIITSITEVAIVQRMFRTK
ncbi:hypothetical protein Q1695_010394 [Nippostrongylus brasiliensis]|nr:hypothetical protein Q1695_010394 [Nippostrongylus brasiliensis]